MWRRDALLASITQTQDIFTALLVAASVYFSVLGIIGSVALDEDARNQMW